MVPPEQRRRPAQSMDLQSWNRVSLVLHSALLLTWIGLSWSAEGERAFSEYGPPLAWLGMILCTAAVMFPGGHRARWPAFIAGFVAVGLAFVALVGWARSRFG